MVAGKKGEGGGNIFFISSLLQEPSPTPIPLKLRGGFLFGLPLNFLSSDAASTHTTFPKKEKRKKPLCNFLLLNQRQKWLLCLLYPTFFLTFLLPLYIQVGKMTNWRRFPPFFLFFSFFEGKVCEEGRGQNLGLSSGPLLLFAHSASVASSSSSCH